MSWPRTGPTPRGDDQALIFTPHWALRFLPPVALLIPVPFWVAACLQRKDFAALPNALAVLAVAVVLVSFVSARPAVSLTAGALVARSAFCTRTMAWPDVVGIIRDGPTVWVTTKEGSFALPVSASAKTPASLDPTPQTLADEVWRWWLACRGQDWMPTALDPWRPPVTLSGVAILRRRLGPRFATASGLFGALIGQSLFPMTYLGPALVGIALAAVFDVSLVVLYHGWERVTVGPTEVAIRNLRGVRRIPRAEIIGVTERPYSVTVLSMRQSARLVLVTTQGFVTLPAPVRGSRWWDQDPAYYRTWLWLYDELVLNRGAAMAPDHRAVIEPNA